MIDIIIITAYIAVVLKIILKIFQWFEDKYNLYGKKVEEVVDGKKQKAVMVSKEGNVGMKASEGKVKVKQEVVSPSKEMEQPVNEPVVQVKEGVVPEQVPIIQEDEQIKPQEEKAIQPVKEENQPQPQEQLTLPLQVSQVLMQASTSNIEAPNQQQTFTTPDIQVNLPPQNQYTNEGLVQENQQLRDMIEQLQRSRQNEINELNIYVEKLKNDKNKYSEKLIGAVEDFQNEKEQNRLLTERIQELNNMLEQKIENIKQRYEIEISSLKQKLIEQQQQLSKQQSLSNTQSSQEVLSLKSKIEEMKHELEFSQSQLQQAYESEAKMKQQIEKLRFQIEEKHTEIQKLQVESTRMKPKPQISISDIVSHPQYIRVKQKLQRYESGSIGGSGIRSIIQRTEFTPQSERMSRGLESRVTERKSFISNRLNAENTGVGEEEVFAECNFLTPENKHFLLDQIKKIKKLPIKKTKLLFKLDKLHPTNPHENIDNIPNIVLLVELTNSKILATFTQTAFNKDQGSMIADKPFLSRSRSGTNKSLIVDLTNKVSLPNKRANQTIIYDEDAIVWGKDQLVIKNDQPTILYSSFGTQEGVYWDGKYGLEDLLGGNQGFERINQYEFYRIYIG